MFTIVYEYTGKMHNNAKNFFKVQTLSSAGDPECEIFYRKTTT